MADINKYFPKLLKLEGGFSNDPDDKGGATCKGITFAVFKNHFPNGTIEDLKNISDENVLMILKSDFWDKWKADKIENQSIAEILVDWFYNSGYGGVNLPMQVINFDHKTNFPLNGTVSDAAIFIINHCDQQRLFNEFIWMHKDYINKIIGNDKFKKGWLIRIDSFKFEPENIIA